MSVPSHSCISMTTTVTTAPLKKTTKDLNKYFKDHVDIENVITYGKTYKYSMDKMFIKPYLNGDRFVFQSPMLYIPYAPRNVDSYYSGGIGTDQWQLDASMYNHEHDADVGDFRKWIKDLEYIVYKTLRKRTNLGIRLSANNSVLKKDEYRSCSKLVLKLDNNVTNFYMIESQGVVGQRIDYKKDLRIPCYAMFIIEFANIWIRKSNIDLDRVQETTWGISFIIHASQCLPSHLYISPVPDIKFISRIPMPPPPPTPQALTLSAEPASSIPEMYSKMLKMGIPRDAVKHKMIMAGLDPGLLDGGVRSGGGNTDSNPVKITSLMLAGVKLKSATDTPLPAKAKPISKPPMGFAVKLDDILNVKARLKKPNDNGVDTYSKIFNNNA